MITLGLDIGTNSVGSAWIDIDDRLIRAAVSVFPAGVDEADDKRGAPKNQDRRTKRSQRRSIARRAGRKRALRRTLVQQGFFPTNSAEVQALLASNPWELRRTALDEPISRFEWGRILLHLAQRRGAAGLKIDPESVEESDSTVDPSTEGKPKKKKADQSEDAKVKGAIDHARGEMDKRGAATFGQLIAIIMDEQRHAVASEDRRSTRAKEKNHPREWRDPIRNKGGEFRFHADREMIRSEFEKLWDRQSRDGGALADMSETDRATFKKLLDDPEPDETWRQKGLLFGQRRTYWNLGTLGRCDLEPTDRCVPMADRWASRYRVVESVNNIRVRMPNEITERSLTPAERNKLIEIFSNQKTATVATVRTALGLPSVGKKKKEGDIGSLNIERDEERELNTDWFHHVIVAGALGNERWESWDEKRKEGVNRAVLRFEPGEDGDSERLHDGAIAWWDLDEKTADALVTAWKSRPKSEKRLNLSRRAVQNLLPYMERAFVSVQRDPGAPIHWAWFEEGNFDPTTHRWPTQIEARQMFAEDRENGADDKQRERYRLGGTQLSKAKRHYLQKHSGLLPPAPMLTNPVVRKAIHEVRRHVVAHIRESGGEIPDRIVIEFAREATKPAKVSDRLLYQNRTREKIRKEIERQIVQPAFGADFHGLSHNQLRSAIDRVILCRRQKEMCAYSDPPRHISPAQAAKGDGLEIDHIVPYSRCGDNSMSNRVLCYRDSNRNKGKQTPREWWGDSFDARGAHMRFMADMKKDNYKTLDASGGYFTLRDYAQCWKRFDAKEVPAEWRGSQLTDTAYAAKEVMDYLQNAVWPGQPSHLAGGQRLIFVTKGAYTATLRRDWQLYQQVLRRGEDGGAPTPERVREASAKNRGDHREHAVDAVAIALTDGDRIQSLAKYQREVEEARARNKEEGRDADWPKRTPLDPPWGTVAEFRAQVMRQIYGDYDSLDGEGDGESQQPLVVAHRPTGRRVTGALHEETLFGPVPEDETLFVARKGIGELTPNHLRRARPETEEESIERLTRQCLKDTIETDFASARKRALLAVAQASFRPQDVQPPPGKSGIVRDPELRAILREQIEDRLSGLGIARDADSFTKSDMNRILKETGPLTMPSGIPIRRVVLLRTMTSPVVVRRRRWDWETGRWEHDTGSGNPADETTRSRADRAYVGGNNHHIEIREDAKGHWSGTVVPTYDAARRMKIEGRDPVDRSDSVEKGGRFIMSLAEGDTVFMQLDARTPPSYYVVFKLDKPQTIQFKHHWDARRATGEKNTEGNLIPGSEREAFPVAASKLANMAPPGEKTPIKVEVDPLGRPRRIEPVQTSDSAPLDLDPRVVAIARDAVAARHAEPDRKRDPKGGKRPGSWSAMRARLEREGLARLAPQLSEAMRRLRETGEMSP